MDKKVIKLKNGQTVFLEFTKENQAHYIFAKNDCGKDVAKIWFKLNGSTCYLGRIEILDCNYARMGIGSNLLKSMECLATAHRCTKVDGKFYPFGELGEFSKSFYIKNGYEIYKDDYETFIYKSLFKNKTQETKGRE